MATRLISLSTDSLSVGGIPVEGSPAHAVKPTSYERLDVKEYIRIGGTILGREDSDVPVTRVPAVDVLFLTVRGQPIKQRRYVYGSAQIVTDGDEPVTI